MSTVPAVTVGGNDLTAWLQDRSMSIKRQSFDATFLDDDGTIPAIPALGDTVTVSAPSWTGTVNSVISTGYKGNHPFYRVRAVNADVLPDAGAAPFNLADTGTRYSSPAGFKDLEVTRILDNAIEEVRSKCIVFKEGVTWGMEIDITSVVEGYSAETFTVMEMTVDWPVKTGATYTLDLGLGVYATATTGGSDGGPLDPPVLGGPDGEIVRTVKDAGGCFDCVDGLPAGDAGIPIVTVPAACDASPDGRKYRRYDDGDGVVVEVLGASGSADQVASWVKYNVPYTDGAFPCPIGGGSWRGYQDEQIVVEYTAPADAATYLGVQMAIDASSLVIAGNVYGYDVLAYPGDATAVTWANSGTVIAAGIVGSIFTVMVPRQFVDWATDNCIILRPRWECDRPVQFCNEAVDFSNPHADGRGHSGSYDVFSFDDVCAVQLTPSSTGQAVSVPGIGDVDGTNATFELISWTGTGGIEATINGLPISSGEYSLDTGAHEVTFTSPPPSMSIVLFTYHAVT